jgi:hypothetical protein
MMGEDAYFKAFHRVTKGKQKPCIKSTHGMPIVIDMLKCITIISLLFSIFIDK